MLKNDRWIKQQASAGMIEPFTPELVRRIELRHPYSFDPILDKVVWEIDTVPALSYGCSSYGYDLRLSPKEFLIFRHIPGTVMDPKRFNPDNLEPAALHSDSDGAYFILPAHSYGLGVALEKLKVPANVTVICLGKSTYARCFSGDTKVRLVDGDFTFLELIDKAKAGERLYGFGVLDGRIIAQELVAPRLIEESQLLEVELDNGELIHCTPDHGFLLRDGTEKEAQHLQPGDSLHAFYDWEDHGYPGVYDPVHASALASKGSDRRGARTSVHRMVARDILDCEDLHVHHRDGIKTNNHPDNLALLTQAQHTRLHNQEDLRHLHGGRKSAEKFALDSQHRKKILNALHCDESKRKALEGRRPYLDSEESRQNLAKARKKRWLQPDARAKQSAVAHAGAGALRRRKDVTSESLTNALLATGSIRGAARMLSVDRSAFRRFHSIIEGFRAGTLAANHKICNVRRVPGLHPTYCLAAPRTGNFALSAGVFVKNCGIILNTTPAEAGWEGHLTLEFSNSSGADCRIYANEGICQLLFFEGDPCDVTYEDRDGKYQHQPEKVVLARV